MGGVNPYIEKVPAGRPQRPFTVTFVVEETGERRAFGVDPAQIPFARTGLEGSVLDIAFGAGVEIDHACGGVCACATCHVKVREGGASCPRATEDEEDMLDSARDLDTDSRLSCQCVPDGSRDLVVVVPNWNTNYAREGT